MFTLYQANAATLMPFSEEDNILIKNLYEYEGYKKVTKNHSVFGPFGIPTINR